MRKELKYLLDEAERLNLPLVSVVFDESWRIAQDFSLARAIIQELCSIIPRGEEKEFSERLLENLKEFHEEMFEED